MSEWLSAGALTRSIRQLGGASVALDELRAQQGFDQLQEIETQIQVPIYGVARERAGWNLFSLPFDVNFVYAPQQRDSALTVPHFSYGPVVSGVPSPEEAASDPDNPDSLVAVFCQVVDWGRDGSVGAITGAVVGIGVSTLGGQDVKFTGYVHLTFQGFGATNVDDTTVGS